MIFLKNVSQLEITNASPKQPQSDTGSKRARYKVSGVINAINAKIRKETYRRYTPNSMQTPSANSIAERLKDKNTVKG